MGSGGGVGTGLGPFLRLKVLLLVLISSVLVMGVVNAGYMGLRYGKRDPSDRIGKMIPRSGNVRNIQSRSGSARFYPGTRFGGKRAYWSPTPYIYGHEIKHNSPITGGESLEEGSILGSGLGGGGSISSLLPYDCVHVPTYGIRCSRASDESYWNGILRLLNNRGGDEVEDGDPGQGQGQGQPEGPSETMENGNGSKQFTQLLASRTGSPSSSSSALDPSQAHHHQEQRLMMEV